MTATTNTLTITRPDDWHLHVRDGEPLLTVVPHTAAQFGRAIIMPNLRPPVTTAAQALEYKQRILAAVPAGVQFEPMMTLTWPGMMNPSMSGWLLQMYSKAGRTVFSAVTSLMLVKFAFFASSSIRP